MWEVDEGHVRGWCVYEGVCVYEGGVCMRVVCGVCMRVACGGGVACVYEGVVCV